MAAESPVNTAAAPGLSPAFSPRMAVQLPTLAVWRESTVVLIRFSSSAHPIESGGCFEIFRMNQHNSNYRTFHHVKRFRKALAERVEVAARR